MKKVIFLWFFLLPVCFGWSQNEDTLIQKNTDSTLSISTRATQDSFIVVGKPIKGRAGVYSSRADGSVTASGERLDNTLFTAASNKFELGTWVKVTNLKNGHWVLVRINDRTSRRPGADIIEISRIAVARLGFLRTGSANVKLEKIIINNLKSVINDTINEIVLSKDTVITVPQVTTDSFRLTGKVITGIASYYSSGLDGTLTSTGEKYRNKKLTAASNNFPLHTWVLVTNLRNQKSVIVRINDRMHPRMKKKGRVVDLSGNAALELDMLKAGIVKVKVEVLERITLPDNNTPDHKTDSSVQTKEDSFSTRDTLTRDTIPSKTEKTSTGADSVLTGIAGIYSSKLDGATTATGEIYRHKKLSAACNNYPLHSWIRVTNLQNGKSVILRINDRIRLKKQKAGEVIDLSRSAAQQLGFLSLGKTSVKVEPVPKGTLN